MATPLREERTESRLQAGSPSHVGQKETCATCSVPQAPNGTNLGLKIDVLYTLLFPILRNMGGKSTRRHGDP